MEKYLKYQDRRIFYRVIGNGKPVFLLHGFGVDGGLWNNQIEFLQNKFQVIVPDLPGSGSSEMIDDMSIEGMAEVIKSIIDHEMKNSPSLGRGKGEVSGGVTMIGHSMGGYISLAIAEKYPELLRAYGLFHSTTFADNEEKKAVRQKAIDFIDQHGSYEFLKTTLPNLFYEGNRKKLAGTIKGLIDKGSNFSNESLVSYYRAMRDRPDRTNVWKEAKIPVLFIMGKYDSAVPLADSLAQSHLPEKSYIHMLHHTGHMGMLEEAETANGLLEKFLVEN